jgi:hypothetical protein
MSKTRMVLLRIAGSVVGLLAGGVVLGGLAALAAFLLVLLLLRFDSDSGDSPGFEGVLALLVVGLGCLVGGTMGAAEGATITQKLLRQKSSFRRASFGTFVGLLVGLPSLALGPFAVFIIPTSIVAGAVIGSGWKAKPADAAGSEPEPGSSFERQGNDKHCKRCGTELIGPGGPCRKCDDVKTRPCSSCGRYMLTNDKTCVYCGTNLK